MYKVTTGFEISRKLLLIYIPKRVNHMFYQSVSLQNFILMSYYFMDRVLNMKCNAESAKNAYVMYICAQRYFHCSCNKQ